MSSGFAPSLNTEVRDGVRVRRGEYPVGVAGPKLSLETMAQFIREGASSKLVMGWAMDQLHACGLDGRDGNTTNFKRAACILDAARRATVYTPDPPMTELVKSAEAMLCLRPGLCIRGGDCDDGCVLVGSAVMSVGIPVRVIKQTYDVQDHVLIEAQNDDGSWFPMDPSTNLPCGQKNPAREEFRMDPTNPSMIGLKGAPEAQFIAIGRPGRFFGAPAGVALPSSALVSGPYSTASRDLQNQVLLPIRAGDQYYNAGEYGSAIASYQAAGAGGATSVGPEIDLVGAANVTQPYTQVAWQANGALQQFSSSSTAQSDADAARSIAVAMLTAYQAAMLFGAKALAKGGVPASAAPQLSVPQAIVLTLGLGAVAGLALEAYRTWNAPRRYRRYA